jgi:hypothetical protein
MTNPWSGLGPGLLGHRFGLGLVGDRLGTVRLGVGLLG